MTQPTVVLIASYLEPEHVARIAATSGVEVIYEPALLPKPLYQADHHFGAAAFRRTPDEERRWRGYLERAEVLFDFDHTNMERLLQLAPNLKWVQGTSAGIGDALARWKYLDSPVVFTTAGGVHATPLAEFCLWAMLAFAKDGFRMARDQAAHHWERYCGRQLRGTTVGVVGLGRIGRGSRGRAAPSACGLSRPSGRSRRGRTPTSISWCRSPSSRRCCAPWTRSSSPPRAPRRRWA